MSSHTGVKNSRSKLPRAVIHKKILDAAESRPKASVEKLAKEVNGASVGLVERVLDEYGDPAAGEESTGGPDGGSADDAAVGDHSVAAEEPTADDQVEVSSGRMDDEPAETSDEPAAGGRRPGEPEGEPAERATDDDRTTDRETTDDRTTDGPADGEPTVGETEEDVTEDELRTSTPRTNGRMSKTQPHQVHHAAPDAVELTQKQREVLRAIRESPDATQSELADRFDVTQSTINNRLNSIEGFDWKRRHAFIEAMLDDSETTNDDAPASASVQTLSTRLADLHEQIEALERRLDDSAEPSTAPFDDPDLACKVVRACIESEDVTVEEENRVMKAVIAPGGGTGP